MEWVELNIFPIGGMQGQDKVILNHIRPFINKLQTEERIQNFHFLREEQNEIRFRLCGEQAKFKAQADEWLKELKAKGLVENRSGFNTKYDGEEGAAGKIGQDAYYAYMKSGSEIAFCMLGKNFEMKTNFYHYRGFHFILNSCGFGIGDEINFYINDVVPERLETFRAFFPTDFHENKEVILKMLKDLYERASKL